MTEQEFLRQIWRAYDVVELESGMRGAIVAVSFPTRSVKIAIEKNVNEWFRCDAIAKHISRTGSNDDDSLIESLHMRILSQDKQIEKKNAEIKELKEKLLDLSSKSTGNLEKAINRMADSIREKKKNLELAEQSYQEIMGFIERNKKEC